MNWVILSLIATKTDIGKKNQEPGKRYDCKQNHSAAKYVVGNLI